MNGNLIVKHASELVTCSGFEAKWGRKMQDIHPVNDGAVLIQGGIIQAVGETATVLAGIDEADFEVIDASNRAVLPGFVDSHTHLVFGGFRDEEFAWRLSGRSYMEIMDKGGGIVKSVTATRKATFDELFMSAGERLYSMLCFGVTTMEAKSGYGLDLECEIKQLNVAKRLDQAFATDVVSTYLGAHALDSEYWRNHDDYIKFIIHDVLPKIAGEGLAEFCDVFCEKDVFSIDQARRLLKAASDLGLKPKIHADEVVDTGGAGLAAEVGAVSADHLLKASDEGIRKMIENRVIATLLPITAFSLREPYAPARKMIDLGCAVALASDLNPGSCFSESVPLIFSLATLYMGMTTEEAVTALTINGAAALGRAESVGSLDPGKKGDLVVLSCPSYRFIPYHIGVNSVTQVVKNGIKVVG